MVQQRAQSPQQSPASCLAYMLSHVHLGTNGVVHKATYSTSRGWKLLTPVALPDLSATHPHGASPLHASLPLMARFHSASSASLGGRVTYCEGVWGSMATAEGSVAEGPPAPPLGFLALVDTEEAAAVEKRGRKAKVRGGSNQGMSHGAILAHQRLTAFQCATLNMRRKRRCWLRAHTTTANPVAVRRGNRCDARVEFYHGRPDAT